MTIKRHFLSNSGLMLDTCLDLKVVKFGYSLGIKEMFNFWILAKIK